MNGLFEENSIVYSFTKKFHGPTFGKQYWESSIKMLGFSLNIYSKRVSLEMPKT